MPFPRSFFSLTPFKAGCLVVLAACLFFLSFDEQKPELIAALDSRGMDGMFRLRGAQPTQNAVVIVDIDEKSLRALGQWPWPRDVVARLVDRIRAAGARVVGFDVVFAEEDRTSPHRALAYLGQRAPHLVPPGFLAAAGELPGLNNDQLLGDAVAGMPSVLGYVFLTRDDGLKDPAAAPFPSVNVRSTPGDIPFDALRLVPAYRAVINVPAVSRASSEGFFNFFPDASGMVHKVPLFLQMDGIPYPSLALEMLRVAEGETEAVIHTSRYGRGGRHGMLGVTVGRHFIPTDDFGQMAINYRGPVGTFPYLPAIDILNGERLGELKDRYVLIGTTAAGLHDLRATPFSTIFPGVEIHATVIDNLLRGDIMTHDPMAERGLTFLLIIIGGVLLSALLAYGSPLLGGIGGCCFLLAALAGNYQFFFCRNQIVGLTYPLLVILAIFPVVSLFNYFFVGREKRFIDRAFSRYISPQVVQQLKRNPGQLTLSGEEKELTVLFSDIRGFTTISEQMTALQLGRFMNRYLTAMSREILAEHGTVDKFIGDAIMAIWGAPLADPGHAEHGVAAALAMVGRLRELQPAWAAEGLPCFEIGIGINTGVASVGNFGSEERFDYTVIGDNVNLASRLEGLTKLYGVAVIISETTREAIGERFFCRRIDRVRVKGREHPVTIFEPLLAGEPPPELGEEVARFEAALDCYFERRFTAAAAILAELHSARPQRLYRHYLDRIAACLETPPPEGWDGVTVHARK
ncbi:MAG: adenylate/guanylate cyclase domain-containing protein [Deltaproteobacteria bacterium]|nr:MAG: adenylate/guanylate cyclase domain-containing protein [Deltaproteobacteria bacterium]